MITVAIAARERALRLLAEREPADLAPNGHALDDGGVPGSDVPMAIREKYGQKLVMYGSTQTHSLGAKVYPFLQS